METTTNCISAEELLRMPDDGHRYELVRGALRKSSPLTHLQGRIAARIALSLIEHVSARNLGEVFSASTGFQLASNPDHVRGPDVAFVQRERLLTMGEISGFWPGAPDLAVEVIAQTDTFADVEEKVLDWLQAGTRLVIVISPQQRTVTTFRSPCAVRILGEEDTLKGGDLVPGWSMPVQELLAP
jgi:Uma2 family endonuclease